MKSLRLARSWALFLLLGTIASAQPQNRPHEQGAPPPPYWLNQEQSNGRPGPAQPEARGPQGRPWPMPGPRQQHWREDDRRAVWRDHRAQHWQSEHRDWRDRGGYDGYRIPAARFRSGFGPRHAFRLQRYPVGMIGGFIHFQFGGFGFSIIDPLPEYWSDRWYDNDDVYIDDSGDGYYLYNRRHPQDRIAISVNIR